ncbi:ATPase [Sphingobium amiense]|uniref:ATPase n=2 Tax=Sphingobium amiense TaxID=135719 RepID=A0A494VX21_9SPHN|nr:ATPase [Sphingobium amiense]
MANWRPPADMTARVEHFDPRPGGRYRMVLVYPDGSVSHGKSSEHEDVIDGRFVEIFPDERLVEEVQFESDDPRFQGTMTITTLLVPVRDGTRLTITATNVPPGISESDHRTGMEATLRNLANFVE